LEKIGPPQRVENRLWDWLIRATRQGAAFSGPFHAGNDGREPGDLPALAPSRPARESNWLLNHLREFDPAELVSSPPPVAAATLRAGLYQWHDYLDESHQASQSIEGEGEQQFGDYWHAIMHRREPDYGNAKYWFRQLGPHALHRPLRERAAAILGDCGAPEAARWLDRLQPGLKWDPFAFVDLCEACAGDESAPLALAARRIQFEEMSLLMSLTLEPFRGPKASDAKRP
jgi:hypothetical protein